MVDFTATATALYGTNPTTTAGTARALWMGDLNGDGTVRYTGVNNDRDPILAAIGGTLPTQVLTMQYRIEDVNMDGIVKYVGVDNDRDLVLTVIGGTIPTAVRNAQVP